MPEHKDLKREIEEAIRRLVEMQKHDAHETDDTQKLLKHEGDETQRLLILLAYLLVEIDEQLKKENKTLIRIEKLLEKLVTSVTVVTVKTDADSYEHAKPVTITGAVVKDGVPQPNEPVNLKVTDIKGTEFPLPDATTGTDGTYTAAPWTLPAEVAAGACTLSATAQGVTVTSTFTSNNKPLSE